MNHYKLCFKAYCDEPGFIISTIPSSILGDRVNTFTVKSDGPSARQ